MVFLEDHFVTDLHVGTGSTSMERIVRPPDKRAEQMVHDLINSWIIGLGLGDVEAMSGMTATSAQPPHSALPSRKITAASFVEHPSHTGDVGPSPSVFILWPPSPSLSTDRDPEESDAFQVTHTSPVGAGTAELVLFIDD